VFRRAEALRVPCSDLVFPGQKLKTPLSDMTLLKIMRDMETGVTVHGFRSAFRDWVAEETSYPGEVAEAALAHAIYTIADEDLHWLGERIEALRQIVDEVCREHLMPCAG
jgi:integrase